jgi:protein-L-isoaspartate(D-aspartate) O-methyltransferase
MRRTLPVPVWSTNPAMTEYLQQRINMVESQVRPSDVTDRRILRAMLELPREDFVPQGMRSMAYMDEAVQVAPHHDGVAARYLLPPRTLAKLVQLAELEGSTHVLDVGPATGYSTALLAKLAARVVALEVDAGLCASLQGNLAALGLANVRVVEGPLPLGAAEEGPFDVILLNGAVEAVDRRLLDQLKEGGRMVGVMASGTFGRAHLWRRSGDGFDTRPDFDAAAPPIPGFARPPGFVF